VLAELLAELGWSPRALARRLNRLYGAGTVAESAPYHWRDSGGIPRPPIPTYVATALGRELGRIVSVEELWRGRAPESPMILTADEGIGVQPWSRNGMLAILEDWVVSGLVDRRQFLAVTGAAITTAIAGYDPDKLGRVASAAAGGRAGNPLLEQIEQSIPHLQRLDDAKGGGAHLTYVGTQFRAVAVVLQQGGHATKIEARLLACLSELGQLAGWMALDAGKHGLAQRYLLTALRAAEAAGYRSMAAHILADLSFQAAGCEEDVDAVYFAEAAQRAALGTPATVHASVLSRSAYGYAVAGDKDSFDRAYNQSRDIVEQRGGDEPPWMYYLTANHLDAQAGCALTHAGSRALDNGDPKEARPLLDRGSSLLRTGAHAAPLNDESQQRRAMFEGAWLAVAAAGRGDLEQACIEGRRAVARTTNVTSDRSVGVLRTLHVRLRHRHQNEHVADFLPVLDATIFSAS
jgi:hypothetical protein